MREPPVIGGFPSRRASNVIRCFDIHFVVSLNKLFDSSLFAGDLRRHAATIQRLRGPWYHMCGSTSNRDATWRHRYGSTFDQVMACCLTAPSHYPNQYWLVISGVSRLSPRASSQEILLKPILDMSLKIANLELEQHLSDTNEFISPANLMCRHLIVQESSKVASRVRITDTSVRYNSA